MSQSARRLLIALLAGALAGYGVLSINRTGLLPGIHGDSVEYLSAAESFARDGTFEVPWADWSSADTVSALSHFPPGFAVLISSALRDDEPPAAAALGVMAASAAVALALLTLLVAECSGLPAALLTAALLITAPVWVRLHLAVWSEPTFMAVTAALVYLMVRRPHAAWAHGLAAGLGVAFRYVGLAGTLAAAVWGWRGGADLRNRLGRASLAVAPSALFLIPWRLHVASQGQVVRDLGLYGGLGTSVGQGLRALTEWIVPGGPEGSGLLAMILLAVAIGVVGAAWRKGAWAQGLRATLGRVPLLYAGCYAAVVVTSRLLADPRILFDTRMFMPVLVLATLVFASSACVLAGERGTRGWAVLALAGGAWCFASLREDRAMVSAVNERGMYFTFVPWALDASIRWIDEGSGAFARIYANDPALIHFQTGRHARDLPVAGEDLAAFEQVFRASPGAVAFFFPLQPSQLPAEVFVERLGLRVLAQGRMGVVYGPMRGAP